MRFGLFILLFGVSRQVHKRREKHWEKLQQDDHLGSSRGTEAEAAEGTLRNRTLEAEEEIKRESNNRKRTKSRRSERRK